MELHIYVVSKFKRISFDTVIDENGNVEDFYHYLLQCFNINIFGLQQDVEDFQQKNEELIDNIKEFIKIYGKDMKYDSKKLKEFFDQMQDGESFFIGIFDFSPTKEYLKKVSCKLKDVLPKEQKEVLEISKNIEHYYDAVYIDDNTRVSIGEKDKDKRVCRFCGKSKPKVTFNSIAHAISHALGNYHVKLNEECDECNNYFSHIEGKFVNYLKFYKLSNGILNIGDKFHFQDIYRALCKYAISVLKEKKHLDKIENTIRWVRGYKNIDILPPQVGITTEGPYSGSPSLLVLVRKENDDKYPKSIVILTIQQVTFLYTLPTDENVTDEQFNNFLELSNIFDKVEWKWENLSSTKTTKMLFSMNFKQNNPN